MQRFDGHTHLRVLGADPHRLIAQLEQAGMTGAAVFSVPPEGYTIMNTTAPYEERVADVLAFTAAYPDRLFPILWVHPDEPDICTKVADAAARGIKGFKMICNNYYVYEDKAMALLRAIAATGKPVLFHSGILWDGAVSSNYNKPVNWECCLEIPHLKFALAHVSWPWCDENLALYGKFLNAYTKRPDLSVEMFVDITPGTPPIYRREVLTKLHTIGYDIQHNLLFGTDGRADDYNTDWCRQWQQTDDAIYAELGLSEDTVAATYGSNLMRFLGLSDEVVTHTAQTADGRREAIK